MKLKIFLLLILLTGCFTTPTLLSLFNRTTDASGIISINEEENKNTTEVVFFDEANFLATLKPFYNLIFLDKKLHFSTSNLSLENEFSSTFSPPPEIF